MSDHAIQPPRFCEPDEPGDAMLAAIERAIEESECARLGCPADREPRIHACNRGEIIRVCDMAADVALNRGLGPTINYFRIEEGVATVAAHNGAGALAWRIKVLAE